MKKNNKTSFFGLIFKIITQIISYIFSKNRNDRDREKEKSQKIQEDLRKEYHKIDKRKDKKQRDIKDVEDINDQLNNRF